MLQCLHGLLVLGATAMILVFNLMFAVCLFMLLVTFQNPLEALHLTTGRNENTFINVLKLNGLGWKMQPHNLLIPNQTNFYYLQLKKTFFHT